MHPAADRRVLTWRRLLVAAAAGLVVLSLGQAILRGDREALALAVVIVVGLILWRRVMALGEVPRWCSLKFPTQAAVA
jgi:hypothetical protein